MTGSWGTAGKGNGVDRVRARGPVHTEQPLGLGVVGLELVVADRPGRRDAVLAFEHPEVLAPEARQGGAVDLGAATDDVVDRRMKGFAAPVEERIGGAISLGHEELPRAPVLGLTRQVVAALDDEDLRAAIAERVGERAAAHATADDGDVGRDGRRVRVLRHEVPPYGTAYSLPTPAGGRKVDRSDRLAVTCQMASLRRFRP
jgi:hypothetical protein